MKKILLLLLVGLYGLSWANNFGSSFKNKEASVTFTHTSALDSAWIVFGYDGDAGESDTANFYDSLKLLPAFSGDGKMLWADGLELDSIGIHVVKIKGYASDAIAVITTGIWEHKDPTPGDTIQREASIFDPATDTVAYVDSLIEPLTLTSVDSVRKVYLVDSLDQTIAASADTEAIARYTWDYPTRTLTSGAGTGANQVIIRTKSSLDSAVIPKATVAVWNADQSIRMGLLDTDTDSGKATFGLDDGTYNLRIHKYKFQWTVPITIGVSGNKDTTVYATEFTPTPPPSSDLCTVYGYIDSAGLVGHRAQISCTIHAQELRIGTKMLAYYSYTKTVYTNSAGYWEMFLPPNAIITPSGTQYVFEIKSPYQPVLKKWVTVPELVSWEFTF